MVSWLRTLTAVWEAGTVPVQRQWHASTAVVRSPAEMFALGRQQSTANIISVIGDDVLCISHGVVHLLTRGNVFMLAKALMGRGKKKWSLCYVVAASSHKLHRGRKLSVRINCVFRVLLGAAVVICRAAKDLQHSYFQLDGGVVILEICPRDLKSSPWLVTVLYN